MNDVSQITIGSRWFGSEMTMFRVLGTYEDPEGKLWVHYRKEGCPECQEYSCWAESFLSRFTLTQNER